MFERFESSVRRRCRAGDAGVQVEEKRRVASLGKAVGPVLPAITAAPAHIQGGTGKQREQARVAHPSGFTERKASGNAS